ncbi:hypothetical protein O9K51_07443 [Purpureocillium lavendulum]|uniref:Uncharacterized protein n=1 Tax=Purpureocillium lavendulum TaxID=1247861 RepID=A0AB34FMF1_9HYPO|nr:hypothetical protein O9K51_07443 [Purpureocillium lavendulum]
MWQPHNVEDMMCVKTGSHYHACMHEVCVVWYSAALASCLLDDVRTDGQMRVDALNTFLGRKV